MTTQTPDQRVKNVLELKRWIEENATAFVVNSTMRNVIEDFKAVRFWEDRLYGDVPSSLDKEQLRRLRDDASRLLAKRLLDAARHYIA